MFVKLIGMTIFRLWSSGWLLTFRNTLLPLAAALKVRRRQQVLLQYLYRSVFARYHKYIVAHTLTSTAMKTPKRILFVNIFKWIVKRVVWTYFSPAFFMNHISIISRYLHFGTYLTGALHTNFSYDFLLESYLSSNFGVRHRYLQIYNHCIFKIWYKFADDLPWFPAGGEIQALCFGWHYLGHSVNRI